MRYVSLNISELIHVGTLEVNLNYGYLELVYAS